jgi:hypothetical protein
MSERKDRGESERMCMSRISEPCEACGLCSQCVLVGKRGLTLKIGEVPLPVSSVALRKTDEFTESLGSLRGGSFEASATLTMAASEWAKFRRVVFSALRLRDRRRRCRKKTLEVRVGGRLVGRVSVARVLRDTKRLRGSHRRWMNAGLA